jgi:Kef-type K+ transport system membrane component KefB
MSPGFFELTIVLTCAAVFSIIAKMLKQPTILAYIAVGVVINYLGVFELEKFEIFRLFSDLGIMLLLFLVGLEINYASLKMVGKVSLVLGLGQVIFTSIGGFFISRAFGFAPIEAAYIGVALCFSSTIIIVKLLSDKKDLNSLYGKISIGFLLIQDIVAIMLLVMLTSMEHSGGIVATDLLLAVAKAIGLFVAMLWLGRKIMPVLFDKVSYSQEVLFVTSLAWVFALAVLVNQIDFSIEIAGFLAGIALANSSEHFQIANRIRPLRDFFIMMFFVTLGTSFVLANIAQFGKEITTYSLYVLIGNPLIVIILMGILGYRKRTGFLTGLTVAQISEFSLILMAIGLKLGHITEQIIALVTAVGIVTITTSTYLITYGSQIYRFFQPVLRFFEKKRPHEANISALNFKKPVVLIGFHRTGRSLAHNLDKKDLLIIDFDPSNIPYLDHAGYSYIFGDIADQDVFDAANCAKAKMIISTSPDYEDNLILLNSVRALKKRPKIILRAETEEQAATMYEMGVDYVLLPHLSSGHALGEALSKDKNNAVLKKLKEKDLRVLSATGVE